MSELSYSSSNTGILGRLSTLTNRQINFAALLCFTLLTIITTWPVVSNLDGVIIGRSNDVYINPWADWWTAKALSDPNVSLWHTDYLFYPNGANLIYHSFSHLNTLVSLGLRPFLDALPAYNLTILINFVLNSFSMFQLARYLTKSVTAAALAAIVFAFNSQIVFHSAHPVLVSMWCIPWMTLYLIRAVRENSYLYALVAAGFIFLGAAASTLLLILIALWLVLLLIYMILASEFPRPSWKILVTFGFSSFILALPLVFPLLLDVVSNQNTSFVIDPKESIPVDLVTLIIPTWLLWLTKSMYLGVVPTYLFLLAIGKMRRQTKLWLVLIAISLLLAIGPIPLLLQKEINIILPWSLVVAPLLRHMYRMMLLFSFGWAMLTAYGWLAIKKGLDQGGKKFLLAGIFVGLLIYIDYTAAGFPVTPADVSPFYTDFLDSVPDDVALAIVPTGRQEDKQYLYYQTIHEHPITGGVISRSEAKTFSFIRNNPLLRAGAVDLEPVPIPDNIEAGFQQLAEINVGYFILEKMLMEKPEDIEMWREAIPFEPIYEDSLVLVYETN